MNASLSEIESLAKRATRGIGFSWGLAEDAGTATRCLSSLGLPGPELLAAQLRLNDGASVSELLPTTGQSTWASTAGRLCPLVTGATLSDYATLLHPAVELQIVDLSYPLLLVPFVGFAASSLQTNLMVSWRGVRITTDGVQFGIDGRAEDLQVASAQRLQCIADACTFSAAPTVLRQDIVESDWTCLEQLAHRTYAPATEESRMRGAGSDLPDNN